MLSGREKKKAAVRFVTKKKEPLKQYEKKMIK